MAGVIPPRRLPSAWGGRIPGRSSPKTGELIIYINYVAGSLRTMAADGSGDRALIKPPLKGCGQITRVSWSPADQSIMVIECAPRAARQALRDQARRHCGTLAEDQSAAHRGPDDLP